MGYLSDKALRDYAFRVLKSEIGEHEDHGIIVPAKASDEEIAEFVSQMPHWQLQQMYDWMYGSELVE